MAKKMLSIEDIEGQMALELPEREEMALVNVVIGSITVFVPVAVAANICGVQVNVLAQALAKQGFYNNATCTATATNR